MDAFFSFNKPNSSSKNILSDLKNSSPKKEELKFKDHQLLSTDNNNDSNYNLEIIDYPYSSNYNDDKTITVNSDKDKINTNAKLNSQYKKTNPQKILREEKNININFLNNNYYLNSSNSSSGIINNDDCIKQNKMLLNNYYINYNFINVNNINEINKPKKKKILKRDDFENKKIENEINDNTFGVNIEYPKPDIQSYFQKTNENIYGILFNNKADFAKKKLTKKIKINLQKKPNLTINKTIEINRHKHNIEQNKSIRTIDLKNLKERYITRKHDLKIYNTCNIFINKSYNNIKEYKIYNGKLKNIMGKIIHTQKNKLVKKVKTLNKNNTSTILNKKKPNLRKKLNLMNKGKNNIQNSKKADTSRITYSFNNNYKNSLLNRMTKESNRIKKVITISNNKNIIIKKMQTTKNKRKIPSKSKYSYTNPFNINYNN